MSEAQLTPRRNWGKTVILTLLCLLLLAGLAGAYLIYNLPRLPQLLAPREPLTPEQIEAKSTPVTAGAIRDRVRAALAAATPGEAASIAFSEQELTYLLNRALNEAGNDGPNKFQGAILTCTEGKLSLTAEYFIDGTTYGIQTTLAPSVNGDQLHLAMQRLALGRIRVPVTALARILPRASINPGEGELTLEGNIITLDLAPLTARLAAETGAAITLQQVRSEDGQLVIGLAPAGK